MDAIEQKISEYLLNQAINDPNISQLHEPRGWLENSRFAILKSFSQEDINLLDENLFSKLSPKIYMISMITVSAIFAYYPNGTVLWLDNHANNRDFTTFVQKEKLVNWLPAHPNDLAYVLVRLKFNFLGWPKLVQSKSDVTHISELRISHITSEEIASWEYTLDKINGSIQPPKIIEITRDSITLSFFIWTTILGRLFEINCSLKTNGEFEYKANLLASEIGDYFAPH